MGRNWTGMCGWRSARSALSRLFARFGLPWRIEGRAIPNLFAYSVLIAWPLVIIGMFTQFPLRKAVIWAFLGSYLLLPVRTAFDFPGLPALDKTTIPNLVTLACACLLAQRRILVLPRQPPVKLLMAVFIFSPFLTAYYNSAPLLLGFSALPPMTMYDALAAAATQAITLIPFVLGYTLLRDKGSHRDVLIAFAIAGLAYSLPMLLEIRLSPHLHRWVYGFFPHSFGQQMRDGGFRPVVFLGHGLLVASFCSLAILAALGLSRQRWKLSGVPALAIAGYLGVVLILCKSAGAALLAAVFAPPVLWLKPRTTGLIAAALAIVVLAYPMVRGSGLFPKEPMIELAGAISAERAESFAFRLDNEDILLAKANERPVFGWGTWGRNRVYTDDYDSDKDVSVTDGTWIIAVGIYGWVGYLAMFGLLTYPLVRGFRRRSAQATFAAATLTVLLAVNVIDLIPNSSLSPLTWLMAGALCVRARVTEQAARKGHRIPGNWDGKSAQSGGDLDQASLESLS